MKKKVTGDNQTVNGLYINELINGFLGEFGEGRKLLDIMGLQNDILPFSAAAFIQNKRAVWKDRNGNRATISFKYKDNPAQLECYGTYLKRRKTRRLFLEWENDDDMEKIARLESEAIGELCMKCIYENLND